MAQTFTRRQMLARLALAGGVAAGALTACGGTQTPAVSKAAPTLVPTVLPTAAPAGAVRPTVTSTVDVAAKPVQPTPTAKPSAAARRDLVIVQGADVTTLDPHHSTFTSDVNATFAIFDNLVFRNEDQSVIRPMLATEWKVQERR